jgi:hypothetical protein
MARKSQAIRLQQSINTLEAYTASGLGNASQARFMIDMIARIKRGKYPSKRQREWLDSIIEEGVPTSKGDPEYIAKIDEALDTEGIDFSQILTEFRGKLVRGWDLSEKQKAWCDSLIVKAAGIRDGSYWRPDAELTERIKLAVSLMPCYSDGFWDTHPGGHRAMSKAVLWLDKRQPTIDEYTVEKLFKSVKGKLRELENPKFEIGSLAYCEVFPNGMSSRSTKMSGIVVSAPIPTRHGISYEILVNGEILSSTRLSKRRS